MKTTKEQITFTRINNDFNSNPRYVCHYLSMKLDDSNATYNDVIKAANKIGGRKFHNKQYGGGIVFQSYNIDRLSEIIIENRI